MANYNNFRGNLRYIDNPRQPVPNKNIYETNKNAAAFANYGNVADVFSNIRQHPTLLNDPVKYSDENPFDRNVDDYRILTRTTKLFISDLKKNRTSDTPDHFSIELIDNIRHIRSIRPIKAVIDYTPTATAIKNGFVFFPDFNKTEKTSDGQEYHAYFPVTQGTAGTPVIFDFVFQEGYFTEFKRLQALQNKIRIVVLKEDTSGNLEAFTEVNSFSIELDVSYI